MSRAVSRRKPGACLAIASYSEKELFCVCAADVSINQNKNSSWC